MTQLSELKLINDSNILYLKKLNKNYKRNEIIKNILDDEACFFKMNKSDAYIILQDIGILSEQIDIIYQKLTSSDEFYRLFKSKKIDLNDKDILIKYPIYDADDLFKNKKADKYNDNTIQNTMEFITFKESFIKKVLNKLKEIFKM